jgi:hypothetical protein
MGKNQDPGSRMNNPDHISESLVDYNDPGSKTLGSGINIPDPEHWYQQKKYDTIGWNLCRILLAEDPRRINRRDMVRLRPVSDVAV